MVYLWFYMVFCIITGDGFFADKDLLYTECDAFIPKVRGLTILNGGLAGAEELALEYALERKLYIKKLYPDFSLHGAQAPYMRNEHMMRVATHMIAFVKSEKCNKVLSHLIKTAKNSRICLKIVLYS